MLFSAKAAKGNTVFAWAGSAEVDLVSRALLAGVFFVAGAAKVLRPQSELRAVIRDYRILPGRTAGYLAAGLPWLELAVAGALLTQLARPVPGLVAALMLGAFSAAVAINLIRGRRNISCGCFGSFRPDAALSWGIVVRNGFLTALALRVATVRPAESVRFGEAAPLLLLTAGVVVAAILVRTAAGLVRLPSHAGSQATDGVRPPTGSVARETTSSGLLAIEMGREPTR